MKSIVARINRAWKLFFALVIVVLRSREHRRKLMFFVSLMAMFTAFLGIVVFDGYLTEHVVLFLAYWLFCGALVLLMLLLAVYDMIRIRAEVTGEALRRLGEVFREVEGARDSDGGDEGRIETGEKERTPREETES